MSFTVLCLLVAGVACATAASTTKLPILMCDDTGYDGGCQNFAMTMPAVGTCSDCNNLVRTESAGCLAALSIVSADLPTGVLHCPVPLLDSGRLHSHFSADVGR